MTFYDLNEQLQKRVFNNLKINMDDHPSLQVIINEIREELLENERERIINCMR